MRLEGNAIKGGGEGWWWCLLLVVRLGVCRVDPPLEWGTRAEEEQEEEEAAAAGERRSTTTCLRASLSRDEEDDDHTRGGVRRGPFVIVRPEWGRRSRTPWGTPDETELNDDWKEEDARGEGEREGEPFAVVFGGERLSCFRRCKTMGVVKGGGGGGGEEGNESEREGEFREEVEWEDGGVKEEAITQGSGGGRFFHTAGRGRCDGARRNAVAADNFVDVEDDEDEAADDGGGRGGGALGRGKDPGTIVEPAIHSISSWIMECFAVWATDGGRRGVLEVLSLLLSKGGGGCGPPPSFFFGVVPCRILLLPPPLLLLLLLLVGATVVVVDNTGGGAGGAGGSGGEPRGVDTRGVALPFPSAENGEVSREGEG